jgi:hypothetical protein
MLQFSARSLRWGKIAPLVILSFFPFGPIQAQTAVMQAMGLPAQSIAPAATAPAAQSLFAGRIVDAHGHAIARAMLTLLSVGQELALTTTDEQGGFQLFTVPGTFQIKVTVPASGANKAQAYVLALSNETSAPLFLTVQNAQAQRLPLGLSTSGGDRLEILASFAQNTATVTVSGESQPIEQETSLISHLITGKTLENLPENGRNLSRLSLLDPQVRNTSGLGSDAVNGARLNINADIFRMTSYTIDGNNNREIVYGNAPLMALPISGVAEMKVLTNQYNVQFGRTTTGIIAYSTRTGTDSYHGQAALFGRPSGLQSAPPVSTVRMPNRLVDGYGLIGGPLLSPRTHFLADYEQESFERGSFIQSPTRGVYLGNGGNFYALGRLDRQLNSANALRLRINGHHSYTNNPNDRIGGIVQPSAGQTNRTQSIGVEAALVTTQGNRLNTLQFQFTHALPYILTPNDPSVSVSRPGYSTEGGSNALHLKNMTEDLHETLQWTHAAHTFALGLEGTRTQAHYISATPFGAYTFASGAPTTNQQPTTYSQTFGVADTTVKDSFVAAFAQDTWHVLPALTLTLGLRYEYQGLTGDANNLAPRIGLAYNLFGNGSTILRAGFGYFYGENYLQLPLNAYAGGVNSPTTTYTFTAGQTGFPIYPNSLDESPASGQGNRDLYLLPPHLLNPYNMQVTLGIEQNLGKGWILSVNGIHAVTRKQLNTINLNAPSFVRTAPGQIATSSNRPLTTYAGVAVNNVIEVQNGNSTTYDALRVDLVHHFGHLFDWNSSYLYTAALTYNVFQGEAATGVPNDWYHPKAGEYGPTDFNQRHRSVSYGNLHLPWESHLSGIFTAAAGLPVNPITGVDNNKDGYTTDRPVGFSRNSFRGPKQFSVDLTADKNVHLSRQVAVDLRIEAFNLLNHSNFVVLNNVYGNAASPVKTFLAHQAGLSNSDPGRQLQFGARFTF